MHRGRLKFEYPVALIEDRVGKPELTQDPLDLQVALLRCIVDLEPLIKCTLKWYAVAMLEDQRQGTTARSLLVHNILAALQATLDARSCLIVQSRRRLQQVVPRATRVELDANIVG